MPIAVINARRRVLPQPPVHAWPCPGDGRCHREGRPLWRSRWSDLQRPVPVAAGHLDPSRRAAGRVPAARRGLAEQRRVDAEGERPNEGMP